MAPTGGVEFAHVSFTPPGADHPILNDVSLQLEPGTTTALLGRSGSGKTTLLRTVNGLVLPTAGTVTVSGGKVGSNSSPQQLRDLRHTVGYVIQETGLFPHMTIERNVALPLELAGKPADERRKRAHDLLTSTGLDPAAFAARHPHELSGGQRQRVGLARALSNDPSPPAPRRTLRRARPPHPRRNADHAPRPARPPWQDRPHRHARPAGSDLPGPPRRLHRQGRGHRRSPLERRSALRHPSRRRIRPRRQPLSNPPPEDTKHDPLPPSARLRTRPPHL